MMRNLGRLICGRLLGLAAASFVLSFCALPQASHSMDTPNLIMGVDGMVLRAGGLFRDPGSFEAVNGNDGFNTFQFGTFTINNPITTGQGKYDAFRWQKTGTGACCISHNSRIHSDTPETIDDPVGAPGSFRLVPDSITKDFMPIIDQRHFGQVIDPSQYQIEVKFKPLLQQSTANSLGTNPFPTNPTYPNISAALENTANSVQVGLDLMGGFVWDAEAGRYKRANEGLVYNIGSDEMPLNTWYASAPHDAQGYATYTVPVSTPTASQRGFYYGYGSGIVRDELVTTLGGRAMDEEGVWNDVTVGFGENYQPFGGGPADPNNPNSKLNTPNGISLISFGAPDATVGVSLEIKSISLKKITPTNLVARIDGNSGVSFTFGSGFTYGATQAPISVPGASEAAYLPPVTNQISRFDANGITNLKFNMRTPDNPETETHRFFLRTAAADNVIDATNATVNVRAKLMQPLTDAGVAQSLTLVVKGRKGNDTGPGLGADEWIYNLDLSQFNTTSMTSVSIPMSAFTLNMNASTLGAAPAGFANAGDGLLTNFGLYEFGGLLGPNSGVLRLEMEYMELRTPSQALVGDYTGDGKVDAADYTKWRDNLGAAGSTLGPNRDPANSGVVSTADYNSWKAHFGQMAGSGSLAAGAVPEPATLSLLVGLVGLVAMRRRIG